MEAYLIKAIGVLLKRWKFILTITVLLGLIGAVRGIVWPTYQAQALVVVTPLGAGGESAKLVGEPYPAKVYYSLLLSPQTLGATIDRLVAAGKIPRDEKPEIDDFGDKLSVYVETVDATTRPVTYSPLIRLTVVNENHDMAIAIVREWSAVAVELANTMLTLPLEAASKTLAQQSGALEKQLGGIWKQIADESGKFDIELMRKEAELRVEQLDKLETEKLLTSRELDGLRQSLASVTETLTKEKPYIELARAPSDEAFWMADVNGGKRTMDELGGKVMVSQVLNEVYWENKKKEADLLGQVAASEAKLADLDSQTQSALADRQKLEALIGEHTVTQRDLTTQETIAKSVYEDVAKSKAVNESTLAMIKTAPDSGLWPVGLNALSSNIYAIRSGSLLSGRKAALVAAVLGFLLSACIVVFREVVLPWWRSLLEEQRKDAPA